MGNGEKEFLEFAKAMLNVSRRGFIQMSTRV